MDISFIKIDIRSSSMEKTWFYCHWFLILYTILNVRSQSLENHQLIVIIVTGVIAYIFVRSFFNKDKEIKELKRNLKSYDSKILNENIDIVKRVEILKTLSVIEKNY